MEDEFVSSSLSTTHLRVKTKLKRDRWDDYLCSNFNRTESWYRAEIDKLRSEISDLEAELNEDKQSFSTVHLLQTLDKLTENLPHDKKALLDGKDIHGKLHDDGHIDIERLEKFTGLYIHDIIIQVEKDDGVKCIRKHQIQGACRGIEFQMKFSVEEVTQQDSQSQSASKTGDACEDNPRIIYLEVGLKNEEVSSYFLEYVSSYFLEYVQEEKQLQQFFVTLQCYGKWKKYRLKTFNHFRNKYPELVTYVPLQDDDVMTACNKQHPNFLINIVWKIIISRTGDVKPTFAM
ncbi:centromere protein P-like isoform X1 [Xenia sp. Carnegie-2017]|uniref:centromere protein P-like isoform X1 n=1 Tax=Xenia sp. Carnegie-2017 TaxID=2897299 RepID=UPI001F042A06|nr:centromere protein P-like isoform X1 [Xenia sp. Carnegie-2017]